MVVQRNNLVELARFLYSLLVVGYHVQMTWAGTKLSVFEGGALAVEFFFLISGYFLARSVERISSKDKSNIYVEYCRFMWGKLKALLVVHIVAIIAVIIVILCTKLDSAGDIIVNGLPSMFLIHMIIVWNSSFNLALIVPEWYLSSMLVTMAFMVPIALLCRKKMKGIFATIILIGVLLICLLICGFATSWALPQNFVYDLRAWGEMCVGMFAFYLSTFIAGKELNNGFKKALPIVEIVLYVIPIIFGIVPFPADYAYVTMIITVICVFGAISITFSKKGLQIKSQRANSVFGYLGAISLPIYLFHPVYISLFDYARVWNNTPSSSSDFSSNTGSSVWKFYLVIFPLSIVSAVIYKFITGNVKKLKNNRKKSVFPPLDFSEPVEGQSEHFISDDGIEAEIIS